jgi:hypothetical protein
VIFGSAAARRQPRQRLVPDEVVAMLPSSSSAWRNFVSALGEKGAVGVFAAKAQIQAAASMPPHRSNRHCLNRRIFLLATSHNVQHTIRHRFGMDRRDDGIGLRGQNPNR